MKRIILEMEDSDMARLENLAHYRDIGIDALARLALRQVLDGEDGRSMVQQPMAAYGALEMNGGSAALPRDPAEARAARLAALSPSSGMVKDRVAVEVDGLAYQKEMRAEWR